MVDYRRNRVPGGTYFFTVTLRDRSARALVDHVTVLRESVATVRTVWPFTIDAMVVLPDHLHALWTLPEGDTDYSTRWRLIKSGFSRGIRVPSTRGVWQNRFWEHTIRDDDDYRRHVEYIWFNPVKHGHVERVRDWPYSSFHRAVRRGLVAADWGGSVSADQESGYGE